MDFCQKSVDVKPEVAVISTVPQNNQNVELTERSVESKKPSTRKTIFLNCTPVQTCGKTFTHTAEEENFSVHYSTRKTAMINVQEEYHTSEDMEVYTLNTERVTPQPSSKTHNFPCSKPVSKHPVKSYKSPVLDCELQRENLTARQDGTYEAVKRNLLSNIGTPEVASKNLARFKSPEMGQPNSHMTYKEMIKSNITSFREAVDICNSSKLS